LQSKVKISNFFSFGEDWKLWGTSWGIGKTSECQILSWRECNCI